MREREAGNTAIIVRSRHNRTSGFQENESHSRIRQITPVSLTQVVSTPLSVKTRSPEPEDTEQQPAREAEYGPATNRFTKILSFSFRKNKYT